MSLLNDIINRIGPLDEAALLAARARQAQLTKPDGSLGRLEDLSVQIAGHRSVERGHMAVFAHLDLTPLLDLGMRLGEGTGAVLAQSLCMAACKTLDEMATFGEAGVSEKA
jgi:NaMN:DMB phosphoribosyltransferase